MPAPARVALPDARSVATGTSGRVGNWDIKGLARIVRLEEGLHALTVGPLAAPSDMTAEMPLPAICVSAGPANSHAPVEVGMTSGDFPGWLGAEGGTAIVKVPSGGGFVVLTTYGIADEAELPEMRALRLDQPGVTSRSAVAAGAPAVAPPPPAAPPQRLKPEIQAREIQEHEIPIEMTVHIERQGDRLLPARGWVGNPGQRLRIEAFSLRPLEAIAPGDIEYMAFGPGDRRTPWVSDAKLCGTRGRGLPLTGFAIRLAPRLNARFDVVYEGAFFASGIRGPARNGEPCLPAVSDDPLEAIRLRVVERAGA